MTPEQKLAAAPEIEGHAKWKVSERFVFYQTEDGKRDLAYDLTKAEQRPIKEFPICPIDNFTGCVLTYEDLESGGYWLWLNTLSQPFDPAKIKDVPLTMITIPPDEKKVIIYTPSKDKKPNFPDPSVAPFHRLVTTGVVYHQTEKGTKSFAILLPVEYYDKNDPQNSKWVMMVKSFYFEDLKNTTPETNPDIQWVIDTIKHHMNYQVIVMWTKSTTMDDPIIKACFERYPDMNERFERFLAGDVSALSGPDIFVLTHTIRSSDNILK